MSEKNKKNIQPFFISSLIYLHSTDNLFPWLIIPMQGINDTVLLFSNINSLKMEHLDNNKINLIPLTQILKLSGFLPNLIYHFTV